MTLWRIPRNIKVAVLVKHARVEQLIFGVASAAVAVRRDQIFIRESRLRVFVEVLHVRVGRCRIEIEIAFLRILTVIPFAVAQPEQPFLHDRIFSVPQPQREAETLTVVGNTGEAVFAPTVSSRTGLIMGEVIPGVSAFAVVLTDGSPLTFAQVRSPLFPGSFLRSGFFKTGLFGVHQSSPFTSVLGRAVPHMATAPTTSTQKGKT